MARPKFATFRCTREVQGLQQPARPATRTERRPTGQISRSRTPSLSLWLSEEDMSQERRQHSRYQVYAYHEVYFASEDACAAEPATRGTLEAQADEHRRVALRSTTVEVASSRQPVRVSRKAFCRESFLGTRSRRLQPFRLGLFFSGSQAGAET